MKRVLIAIFVLLGLLYSKPATAVPFVCDGRLWLSQANTMYEIDITTNPFSYPALGGPGEALNALGYNPVDNYLYAIHPASGINGTILMRIGSDGVQESLGPVAGLPAPPAGTAYFAGAFSGAGDNILYVKDGLPETTDGSNLMYRVDVVNMTATVLTLSENVSFSDFAFIGDQIYAVDHGGQMVSIDPVSGVLTRIGTSAGARVFGGSYGSTNGLFEVANSGGFYKFDIETGQRTLISSSPTASASDGARCPNLPLRFLADLGVTKSDGNTAYTPGEDVVYTITVSNPGPFGAPGVTVSDPLPLGITNAQWSCVPTSGGSACLTPSGTGAINTEVDLPEGAMVTFTLTLSVPNEFTGDLVNTITVTPGPDNDDPDLQNNTATDTNTQSNLVDLAVIKTNNLDAVVPGSTTTYTVAVTNSGPAPGDGAVVRDDWTSVPGLDCSTATGSGAATCAASGTAGTQCPAAAEVTPENLQTGLAIPALPEGGTVSFTLSCTVTATGQ